MVHRLNSFLPLPCYVYNPIHKLSKKMYPCKRIKSFNLFKATCRPLQIKKTMGKLKITNSLSNLNFAILLYKKYIVIIT